MVNILLKSKFFSNLDTKSITPFKIAILIIFTISFTIFPVTTLIQDTSSSNSPYEVGKVLFGLSDSLDHYNVSGRIASDDKWHGSLYLSYYTDSKYYGKVNGSNGNIQTELLDNNIDYYLVWNNPNDLQISLYKDITGDKLGYLRVYKRV